MNNTTPTVVFDAGGVLLRICRSWKEACARAGEPFDPIMMDSQRMAARKALVREYETGRLSNQEFFTRLASTSEGRYTPEQTQRVHEHWIIEEYAGVAALTRDLAQAGIPTALLSNTNPIHFASFTNYPSMQSLGRLFASQILGLAKPDITIYTTVAAELSRAPTELLFFDDLPDNIAGARSAGWHAELIDHTGDTAAQMRAHLTTRALL